MAKYSFHGPGEFSSVGGTEWLNTPSVDTSEFSSTGGTECPGVGPETEVEEIWLFGSFGVFSTDKHFFRIAIKNVVSLDRRFGVSMPMTSNFTLYLWSFHLRKYLKDPIGLIKLLSKF